jgi:hypothetical protein
MTTVHRAAGTAGIATAILFAILLSTTALYEPATYTDPVRALAFARQAGPLRTLAGLAGVLAGITLVVFFAGLGDRLGTGAPVRGLLARYLGVIAGAALAFGSLVDWIGINSLAAFKDQTAAQHAWVAILAFDAGIYGLTGVFLGIAVLAAGTAMVRERLVSAAAGWLALVGAAVIILGIVLQGVVPADTPWLFAFYIVAGVLLLIWFGWTGAALRRAR